MRSLTKTVLAISSVAVCHNSYKNDKTTVYAAVNPSIDNISTQPIFVDKSFISSVALKNEFQKSYDNDLKRLLYKVERFNYERRWSGYELESREIEQIKNHILCAQEDGIKFDYEELNKHYSMSALLACALFHEDYTFANYIIDNIPFDVADLNCSLLECAIRTISYNDHKIIAEYDAQFFKTFCRQHYVNEVNDKLKESLCVMEKLIKLGIKPTNDDYQKLLSYSVLWSTSYHLRVEYMFLIFPTHSNFKDHVITVYDLQKIGIDYVEYILKIADVFRKSGCKPEVDTPAYVYAYANLRKCTNKEITDKVFKNVVDKIFEKN